MANYYCSARSNYFKVKDYKKFAAWADAINQGVEISPKGSKGYYNRLHQIKELRRQLREQGGEDANLTAEIDKLLQENTDELSKPNQLFCLLCNNADGGGWPSCGYNEESDEYEDIDFVSELSDHLLEGEVAILMEAGAEKLRYITGFAIAVNHKGETLRVSITDIYKLVEETWGVQPTAAEY